MRRMTALAAATLALAGCGSSTDSIGSSDAIEAASLLLEQNGYLPAYKDCVVAEAEDQFSRAELDELAELPRRQQQNAAAETMEPIELKCKERAGGRILNPDASRADLAPIKDAFVEELVTVAREEGWTSSGARCIERILEEKADAEFIEFVNSTNRDFERQLSPIAEFCAGK